MTGERAYLWHMKNELHEDESWDRVVERVEIERHDSEKPPKTIKEAHRRFLEHRKKKTNRRKPNA